VHLFEHCFLATRLAESNQSMLQSLGVWGFGWSRCRSRTFLSHSKSRSPVRSFSTSHA